jgi:hypothetical protein
VHVYAKALYTVRVCRPACSHQRAQWISSSPVPVMKAIGCPWVSQAE